MKVLFSITHYLLLDVFKDCLASLKISINHANKNLKDFKYEILIIGNSTITDKDIIHDNDIKIIQNNFNLGFTKSCNQVFKYSIKNNYDETVLINQDTLFSKETVLNILNSREEINNQFSILSPVQTDDKNQYDFKQSNKLKKTLDTNQNIIEVDFINAACWFINNEIIKKIGAMNEAFHHFGSDDEYIYRLKKINGKLYLINSSRIIHLRSFYKKNYNNSYHNMQTISSFEATAYLKLLKDKNFFYALTLLLVKPFIFLLLTKLSFNNFVEITKFRNINTLVKLNKIKYKLYLDINE